MDQKQKKDGMERKRSFIQLRKFLQMGADRNMLGADALAFAAFQAFARLRMVHGEALVIHVGLLAGDRIKIEKAEVFGNIHTDRAFFQAVFTAGAGNFNGPVQDGGDFFYQFFLPFGKRLEISHEGGVVLQLGYTAHSA